MIGAAFLLALRQIARNAGRSALTALGVLIGVAAVIAMVALGRGASARISADLAGMGQNLLFVIPGSPGAHGASSARPLAESDARAVLREVAGIAGVAPVASRGTVAQIAGERWRTGVTGSDDAYFATLSWRVATGRAFNEGELRSGAAVCLIGDRVRRELFGAGDPLGAPLLLGNVSYRVIGTLQPKGSSTFGQDQDDFVLVPLRTFHRRIAGNDDVSMLVISATDARRSDEVKRGLEALFRVRRHIRPGDEADFLVRDMKEIAGLVASITGVLTSLLAAIAAVSLLVGGIGIMNIMLVAVTERTREIGVRLAIGARRREILLQFLVEALVLGVLGGVAGIAVGLGGSALLTAKIGVPFIVDPVAVAIAFGVSAGIGVVFGFMPARRAARLEPIEALRHE